MIREDSLLFTCATDLERNRLVTLVKSTGAVAYSTYGALSDGWLKARAINGVAQVHQMDKINGNMMLKCEIAVTPKGVAVFAGASGQIVPLTAALSAVISKSTYTQPAGTQGDVQIVPSDATTWTTPGQATAGQIATKGASAWAFANATAGLVAYVADEKRYYICTATNTWAIAKVIGYAAEVGAVGEEIEVYNTQARGRILTEQLPANINYGIVCLGTISVASGATTGTFTDDRIASTDIVFATVAEVSTTPRYILSAVATAKTITATVSGDPSTSGLDINVMVVRAIS